MRQMKLFSSPKLAGTVLAVALAAWAFHLPEGTRQAAATGSGKPVPMILSGFAAQIGLGLKDEEPADWDGEIKLSEGKVVQLAASRPRRGIAGFRPW